MFKTVNMALTCWDLPTDPYDHTQLTQNWELLDAHNHTPGQGVCIPTDGICDYAVTNRKLATSAVDTRVLADNSVTTSKIVDQAVTYAKLEAGLLVPLGVTIPWFRPSALSTFPGFGDAWVIPVGQTLTPSQHMFGELDPALANVNVTLPDLRNKFIMGATADSTPPPVPVHTHPHCRCYWRLADSIDIDDICEDFFGVHHAHYFGKPPRITGPWQPDDDDAGIHCDGHTQYVRCPRVVQDDFSLEIWFNTTIPGVGGSEVNQWWQTSGIFDGETPGFVDDFGCGMDSLGRIWAGVGNPDTSCVTPGSYHDGFWHHLVFCRERVTGNIRIHVDGERIVERACPNTRSLTAPPFLTLGCTQTLSNFFFGQLSEAACYDAVLDDDEIRDHFRTGAKQPSSAPSPGTTGGHATINLAHSHIVNAHSHWNDHDHGISWDGNHAHYFFDDDGNRVQPNTHFQWFAPGGIRTGNMYIPGLLRGSGCSIGSPMTFEGAHNHGGFTWNTHIDTSWESPGTNVALAGPTDIRPEFYAALYLMKVKHPV